MTESKDVVIAGKLTESTNTGGGAAIGGDVDAGGDVTGRDAVVTSQVITKTTTTEESPNFQVNPSIVVPVALPVGAPNDPIILYLVAQNAAISRLDSGLVAQANQATNHAAVIEIRFKAIDDQLKENKANTQILAIEFNIKAIEAKLESQTALVEMRLRTLEKDK